MQTLQPIHFPRPVAIPIWSDDYTDIQIRIRRDGRFDIEEIWLSNSDDGWSAFCSRHGHINFHLTHNQLKDKEQRVYSKSTYLQEQWEAEQQARRKIMQAQSDNEWEKIKRSKAFWESVNPVYVSQSYHIIKIVKSGVVKGVKFEEGHAYWVPKDILEMM